MGRRLFGAGLVLVGLLALLQSSGVFGYEMNPWNAILLVIGAGFVLTGLRRFSWFQVSLGVYIGAAGLFDVLYASGVTPFGSEMVWSKGWPILIIGVGLSALFGKRHWSVRAGNWGHWGGRGWRREWEKIDYKVVGSHHGTPWRLDSDLNVNHGVGDVRVDLTNAEITEGSHKVNVNAWIGDVVVRVPDNVTVSVDAHTNIGQLEVFGECRDGLSLSLQKKIVVNGAAAELTIDARLGIGDLRVVREPAAPRVSG